MKYIEAAQLYFDKKKAEWLAKHPLESKMPVDDARRLIEEVIQLYPLTPEELKQRPAPVDAEFVL